MNLWVSNGKQDKAMRVLYVSGACFPFEAARVYFESYPDERQAIVTWKVDHYELTWRYRNADPLNRRDEVQ